jgi:Tfp pilus assembly protein PilF
VSRFRATRALDAGEALRLAKADFEIRQDAYAYETLAWAQLSAGDTAPALENIEAALATGVEDATVWYHASEIYAANGDDTRAIDYAQRALELSPEFDLFEAARARALVDRLS